MRKNYFLNFCLERFCAFLEIFLFVIPPSMWIFHVSTFLTLLWLRRTMPVGEYKRMFQVPIVLPIIITIIGLYLIAVPFLKVFNNYFSALIITYFINRGFSLVIFLHYCGFLVVLDCIFCLFGSAPSSPPSPTGSPEVFK